MTDKPPVDELPQPGDTFIELRDGVPYIGTQPGDPDEHDYRASVDVTEVLTIDPSQVTAKYDPAELRDPHTGKWIRDPAGKFLDHAIGELGKGERISHKGAGVEFNGNGYRMWLKRGEKPKWYGHPLDAAEAMRRGKHLEDHELKHGSHIPGGKIREPKPFKPVGEDISKLSAKPAGPSKPSELEQALVKSYTLDAGAAGRFNVADRTKDTTIANLEKFKVVPVEVRRFLAKRGAEFYFGTRPVTDLDHLEQLKSKQPHGYGKGQRYSKVAAMVSWFGPTPGNKQYHATVAVGGGPRTYGSGSVNVSAHEAAHALDFHSNDPSQSVKFRKLWDNAVKNFHVDPYYVQADGPKGQGQREFFAEAYASWAQSRSQGASPQETLANMQKAMNISHWMIRETYTSAAVAKADSTAKAFIRYFDGMQKTIAGEG